MQMLLDCLVGIQLLKKEGANYGLTPFSASYLRKDSLEYLGGMYEDERFWENWGKLTEVIRTGKPCGTESRLRKVQKGSSPC